MASNIQLINESFERRYLKEAEISPENKEDNAVLLRNIKECLSRLNEAEMSDEDKKDSTILWDIYNKTQKRANAKLTPEEKSVLAKYGLTRDKNKNIGITNDDVLPGYPLVSRRIGHNAVLNGSDKINLADRARKINDRGIGYENDVALSSHHRLGNGFRFSHPEIDNHREYRDEKTGEWKKIKDKGLLDRERRSQIVNMSSDVEDMKHALKQRNSAKSQLDNNDTKFDAKRDAIQKAYERELAWNEKRRQEASNWAKDDLDTSNDEINSILNRKKKNESLTEADWNLNRGTQKGLDQERYAIVVTKTDRPEMMNRIIATDSDLDKIKKSLIGIRENSDFPNEVYELRKQVVSYIPVDESLKSRKR